MPGTPGCLKSDERINKHMPMDPEEAILRLAQADFQKLAVSLLEHSHLVDGATPTLRIETVKRSLCVDVKATREPRIKCMIGINTIVS